MRSLFRRVLRALLPLLAAFLIAVPAYGQLCHDEFRSIHGRLHAERTALRQHVFAIGQYDFDAAGSVRRVVGSLLERRSPYPRRWCRKGRHRISHARSGERLFRCRSREHGVSRCRLEGRRDGQRLQHRQSAELGRHDGRRARSRARRHRNGGSRAVAAVAGGTVGSVAGRRRLGNAAPPALAATR